MDELDMMHLSDSFFPTGLFATSNGLESMFLDGQIKTAQDLAELNRVFIEQQVGPCDCIALADAHDAAKARDYSRLEYVDAAYSAIKSVRESREASARSGVQLAKCVYGFGTNDEALDWYTQAIKSRKVSGVYPVSMGVCCGALQIRKERAQLMLVYGFVVSNVGAALRLGMVDHLEGQRIIHDLKPLIRKIVAGATGRIEEAWQFCPQIELSQMSHERLDSKMFIT